jgi:glycine/D-amino acid oxidase-like deaminating enzyme
MASTDPNLDPTRLPPSLWAATAPAAPTTTRLPPGEHTADIVIVGGGFSGLSAALHAAERGAKVVLLEAGEIGWGASGRNNGLVIPALTRADPDVLVQAFGSEHGETVVKVLRDSASKLFELVQRHRIECEAVQSGWIQPAHLPNRLPLSRSRYEQWKRRGAAVELLDADQVATLTGSRFWHGGWRNTTGGHINPLAFARGLARAALAAGAQMHTHSPALALERDGSDGWRVRTAQASVRARRVLLATHGYGGFVMPNPWPALDRTIVPVRSYQMATQPLPQPLRAGTQGDLHFAHLDVHGRLVSGGVLACHVGYDRRLRKRIGARLLKLFPQLEALEGGVRFEHLWHGAFAATPDKLPRFWRLNDGVVGWGGCNGRGVAFATALGPKLVDALLDGSAARDTLPFEALRPIGGHAFAPMGVAAGTLYYRWRDRR